MPDPAAPTTLGRYQIAEELGRGAMGVVYLGVDPVIARPVAIKVIKESEHMTAAEVEQFHARFRHEAEAAGRLSHPDIVQVYDIGPNYMVMEYIDGHTLSAAMQGGASFSMRQVVGLVQRAADAIDYAHKNGIVHRDLKPANFMLVEGDGIKVMDFGVARLDNSNLTAAGSVVGSVRYMAPEQMMGEKVDGRADVFSLAAVAYEMLTAQPPFPGKTVTEVVSRVVHGRYVPPREAEPRLPLAAEGVFARAFAPQPAKRYALALDFARDLGEALRSVLDVVVAHRVQTETPTETDGTAVDADTGETATAPASLLDELGDETEAGGPALVEPAAVAPPVPAPPPPAPDADATLMIKAPPAPTRTAETLRPPQPERAETLEMDRPRAQGETVDMRAPGLPPPSTPPVAPDAARPVPVGARTVIMDLTPANREAVLMLESDPAGAAVFIDGVAAGETPLPDREIKFGRHELRLEAPGCEPATIEVELTRQRPLQGLTVSLAPERPKDGTVRAGQHMSFGPDVVAPCRVAGALPAYPPGARERGLAGAPAVEIWVGEKGEVIDLAIVQSAGATLDGALLDAVSHWRFTPARVRGVPVCVRITVQHHFRP